MNNEMDESILKITTSEVVSPVFSLVAKYDGSKQVFQYKHNFTGEAFNCEQHLHNDVIYVPDVNGKKTHLDEKKELGLFSTKTIDNEIELYERHKNKVPKNIKDLKQKIQSKIMYDEKMDWDSITEIMKDFFLKNEFVYSIRRDKDVEMWIYKNGIYIPEAKTYIKEFSQEVLQKKLSPQLANKILFKIEVSSYIDQEDFFENKHKCLQPLENGILNIETKELIDFSPKYIFFNKLPVKYNSSAKDDEVLLFFKEILDDKDIDVLQELTGYCLLKDYPIHKSFMLNGKGSNGKSQYLDLLGKFLNIENTCDLSLNQMEEDNFTLVRLHNKMANISGDIDNTYLENSGNFKKLTDGSVMQVRRKFLTDLKMVNHAKMVFACNELPNSSDESDGFWRRWVLIDFKKSFIPKKEYDLLTEDQKPKHGIMIKDRIKPLLSENNMSGLLNWALKGLDRIMEKGSFSDEESSKHLRKRWKMKSNNLLLFADQMCVVDYGQQVSVSDFKEEYGRFCIQNGLTPIKNSLIEKTLSKEFGVYKHKFDFGWHFKCINLKSKT